jgi:hypothetical protein
LPVSNSVLLNFAAWQYAARAIPGTFTGEIDTMSYISVEIRAYDEARKVVTVAFSEKWPVKLSSAVIAELTLEDCDTIGRDGELAEAGLTDDEACVLKMLFEDEGTIEDFLANPARLIGRASELDE